MNAIEISALSKIFKGKRGTRVEALKGISFSVGRGEVFGFLGPNGAGKSTTIRAIMGLIRPTSGVASIMGHQTGASTARKCVGYLPENPAFYDFLTAEEYLVFVGQSFGMAKPILNERIDNVLALLELTDARKRSIRGYSKGMVQRLGLAQVMLHDPDVYILDEPMSGLDPLGRAMVKDIILELKSRGKCVFFSTHITADVESVCDRVGIILKGELKQVEMVETIMTEGIHGYQVRVRNKASGVTTENYVIKDQLATFLTCKEAEGYEISLVEPKRTNLEEFFLQIVKG